MNYDLMPSLYMKALTGNYKQAAGNCKKLANEKDYQDINKYGSLIKPIYGNLKTNNSFDNKKGNLTPEMIQQIYHKDTLGLFYEGMGTSRKKALLEISKWIYSNSTK